MGISSFPNGQEGLLPMLVVSAILVVTLLKSTAWSILCHGSNDDSEDQTNAVHAEEIHDGSDCTSNSSGSHGQGFDGFSISQFSSLCRDNNNTVGSTRMDQCCVCLFGFEEEQEVIVLKCRHFFHKGCLQEWFNNLCSISRLTCPLCRSFL